MKFQDLQNPLRIRQLSQNQSDIDLIQKLFDAAPKYFQAIQRNPASTTEAEEALSVLPPNTSLEQKFNLGLFLNSELIGYADIINGYPDDSFAYLGLLIFSEQLQRSGFGKSAFALIEQLISSWTTVKTIRLGVADANDVTGFWKKMGFTPTGRILPCHQQQIKAQIIEMEKPVRRAGQKGLTC